MVSGQALTPTESIMTVPPRPIRRIKHLLQAFIGSTLVVGLLVGNAYMASSIGYPALIEPIGIALTAASFIPLIPPGYTWVALGELGLAPELRGRESFIEANPGLWVFCSLFYTIVSYAGLRLLQRYRIRRRAE